MTAQNPRARRCGCGHVKSKHDTMPPYDCLHGWYLKDDSKRCLCQGYDEESKPRAARGTKGRVK